MSVRLSVEVSPNLHRELKEAGEERGMTARKMLVRCLELLGTYDRQRKLGRNHLGFVADPTKLEAEFVL